ncbi:MAG: histidine kinase dimerization/phospho-acceptor domain-containing protein [Rickettsiales bacterium]|nr:histidine kinase dimerization/phospho-acceptor domain-containing protein [Rickettsiales bacterium]
MRSSWAQPSLSRDFALLFAAIVFLLFLASAWVTYASYSSHVKRIENELNKESQLIERALGKEIENAGYFLMALGRQFVMDNNRDLLTMAKTIKTFDNKGSIFSIIAWVSPAQKMVVSSNLGILEKPVDLSDRDYVQQSMIEPWKMVIGHRIDGRVSGHWVVPVAMGVTDNTGKFVGSIMISLDIKILTDHLRSVIKRDGISFAIIHKNDHSPVTAISDEDNFIESHFSKNSIASLNEAPMPNGLITSNSLLWNTDSYEYFRISNQYPYIVLLSYEALHSDETFYGMLWSRLLQLGLTGLFLVLVLWVMRVRMIKPVLQLTGIAEAVSKGESFNPLPSGGPVEIEGLSNQIKRISYYIEETKRIEDELRNKMFILKSAKEKAELDKRSKSEFLAYVCQELRNPLNNIIGYAQVMRDQLYGPIENRKYRQYTADIYQTGNTMLYHLQELMTHAKAETGYIKLSQMPVEIEPVVRKATRFLSDKIQLENTTIKIELPEALPKILGDEFRLQEMLINLLTYALEQNPTGQPLSLRVNLLQESKERYVLTIVISLAEDIPHIQDMLASTIERLLNTNSYDQSPVDRNVIEDTSLNLELAQLVIEAHQGKMDIIRTTEGHTACVMLFFANRLIFADEL